MRLYLVRHGQTEWNALKRLQGQSDIALTDLGRKQAITAGQGVAAIDFDYCYCSPLQRAAQTAQLIWGQRAGAIVPDARLMEIAFGPDEGRVFDRSKALDPSDPISLFFNQPELYVPHEGAESIAQLTARAQSFLSDLCAQHGAQAMAAKLSPRILVVAHGALIKGLTLALTGRPVERFWNNIPPINCAMVVADYDARVGWTIVDECVRLADGVIWHDDTGAQAPA